MTYADAVWESLVLNAKRMVIVNHLLKQYNLKLTDESAVSTIEGYIEQDMEDYGDGNEYGLNLFYADYGVDIDMVRDYYLNNASLSVLRDYLVRRQRHSEDRRRRRSGVVRRAVLQGGVDLFQLLYRHRQHHAQNARGRDR